MDRFHVYLTMCTALLGVVTSPASAQDWFIDAAFDQAFSSTGPLRSPGGFALGGGTIAAWGPLGFHATFRSVADGGDDILQDCSGATTPCVPGMLAVSYAMKSAGIGVSYDFINPTDVMLTLGLTVTRNWRTERVEHLSTGARLDNELPTSLGLSAAAHLRLRPFLSGLRPEFSIHYDYSGRGRCEPDAACWVGHKAFGVSVGFGWVKREVT